MTRGVRRRKTYSGTRVCSAVRFAAVVLFLLAAGCVAASPSASLPQTHPWGIAQCAFVIASVPVDEAKLAARLPPGFAPAPGALAAASRASLDLDAYQCEGGVGLDGAPLQRVTYGSHYATVVAPAALRQAGYNATFVKWDFLAPDKSALARLRAAGFPAHDGSASVTLQGATVGGAVAFADGGGFTVMGTVQAPEPAAAPLPFMEFTPLGNGSLAVWHARLHDAAIGSGAGVVTLAPGWARDLVGTEQAPASLIAGTWNLDEADVTFPVTWPRG